MLPWAGSAVLLGFLVWIVHLFGAEVEGQVLYDVGERFGWGVPPSESFYDEWASERNFFAGDYLVFSFDASKHNVVQVGRLGYLDCNASDPYLVLQYPNNVVLQFTGFPADNNTVSFISADIADCRAGMRFSFHLHPGRLLAPASAPQPASAPNPGDSVSSPGSAPGPEALLPPAGRHYSVGDTFGWELPPYPGFYNDSWVLGKTFSVYDSLYFGFDQGRHTVLQVGQAAYEACNISTFLSAYNLANPTIKLLDTGSFWFICGTPGHCEEGMKFGVKVSPFGTAGLPEGSPTPIASPGQNCGGVPCILHASSQNHVSVWLVLGIIVPATLVVAALKTLAIFYIWRRRQPSATIARSGKLSISQLSAVSCQEIFVSYTLKQINKATRNFSPELEIGSGAFGTVYKGTLPDGGVVAIKRIKPQLTPAQDFSSYFLNEVTILSSVNHRHLVRLVGCCIECEVPILVYEYVPNGTLLEHLQGKKGRGLASWRKRLEIALETAEALAYLHSAAKTPIYHRDVKSSNILLDDKCRAKVADFGISRLVPMDATHVSTAAMGTFGYIDPEYHATGQLTDKSDVYSFGVVLLELITGQKAVDWQRTPHVNLAAFCIPFIRGGSLEDIVDPCLNLSQDVEALEEVQQLADLALVCLAHLREERPTMKEAVEEVVRIKLSSRECRYSDKVKNLDLSPLSYDTDMCAPEALTSDLETGLSEECTSVVNSSVNNSPCEASPSMYQPR